ncbi:methyl-accepting chemotaxis protein [Salipiger abyssi]|uniref:Methyl-accepting chemotaxis protein n=1 Tax=Salipiger abyssi TaxID=1250539 RepID=A0A1P8UTL4_9RHOB|nr:methyl-accepting chemotaxis protein [Salipiger abyssi]APZ52754.1 methyl-accepting chemotaxis protein [Salipiger abyssi]
MRTTVPIRTAILTVVGLAGAVMIGLVIAMQHVKERRDTIDGNVRQAESLADIVTEMDIAFLEARRAEKDFLLRLEDQYIDRHAAALSDLFDDADQLHGLLQSDGGMTELLPQLETATAKMQAYQDRFAALVASNRRLGLDEESGLQGELRRAVHEVETALNAIGMPEMQVKMLMMRRHEKDFIMRGDPKYLDRLTARVEEFQAFPASYYTSATQRREIDELLTTYQQAFTMFVEERLAEGAVREELSRLYEETEPLLRTLHESAIANAATTLEAGTAATLRTQAAAMASAAAGIALFLFLAVALSMVISRPLRAIQIALEKMRAGDFSSRIAGSRIAETAAIGAAVERFRQELASKASLDQSISEVIRACAEGNFSKRLPEPEEGSGATELVHGVNAIGAAAEKGLGDIRNVLDALADGDLTVTMAKGQKGVFEEISRSIDGLVANLTDTVQQLSDSCGMLNATATEITAASGAVSRRSQNSAASLEESAAALQMLTEQVKETARSAQGAEQSLGTARTRANETRSVAESALEAIKRIEDSSASISRITGLIDDVAFQTNLLALNAGVEAARAGEAGRGFAIVAQEVRGLAQRATDAASEINSVIKSSNAHVSEGVELVSASSASLKAIQETVEQFVEQVSYISTTSEEQSSNVHQINTAVGAIDKDVQQNAAALHDMETVSHKLRVEADMLVGVVGKFRLPGHGAQTAMHMAAE